MPKAIINQLSLKYSSGLLYPYSFNLQSNCSLHTVDCSLIRKLRIHQRFSTPPETKTQKKTQKSCNPVKNKPFVLSQLEIKTMVNILCDNDDLSLLSISSGVSACDAMFASLNNLQVYLTRYVLYRSHFSQPNILCPNYVVLRQIGLDRNLINLLTLLLQ